MFNKQNMNRNQCMLTGGFRTNGYDWWWHSFTARNDRTGEEVPFFVEFFLINRKQGGAEPVLGQLPENKETGKQPSYLMVKAGCWGKNACQLHRFFGWDQVKVHMTVPFDVQAEDCHCSETALQGSLHITEKESKLHPEWMCGAGSIRFDLTIDKKIAFNVGYGACGLMRSLKAFEMYWHAEGMKTLYSGTIVLNGEQYTVTPKTCYGYADKNWGRGFTSPWVWLSSNCLKSNITGAELTNSVFDIGGGRPKAFGIALDRQLLSAFYYEGKEYEYNFSKFWTGVKTEFSSTETEDCILWHVRQENRHSVMITDVTCRKEDMLLVNYEEPDGSKRHNRLWNGGNGTGRILLYKKHGKELQLVDDITATHIGCEYGEFCGD